MAHAEEMLMEHYSVAYLKALAVARGYVVKPEPPPDNDSIDAYIVAHGPIRGEGYSPRLGVQLKCTATYRANNGVLTYPLKVKNYNDLRRSNTNVSRVLVVICVPDEWRERVRWTAEDLRLSKCAYWCSLKGRPETKNKTNVSIKLSNLLNLKTIDDLMHKVATGEL